LPFAFCLFTYAFLRLPIAEIRIARTAARALQISAFGIELR
jgi:hypothetical protein